MNGTAAADGAGRAGGWRRLAASPWQLVLGLGIWALWFVLAYGGLSLACALAPPGALSGPASATNLALLALTLLTAALLGVAAWLCARVALEAGPDARPRGGQRPRTGAVPGQPSRPAAHGARTRFIASVAAALHACAALSTLLVGLPLLWLPPCI